MKFLGIMQITQIAWDCYIIHTRNMGKEKKVSSMPEAIAFAQGVGQKSGTPNQTVLLDLLPNTNAFDYRVVVEKTAYEEGKTIRNEK